MVWLMVTIPAADGRVSRHVFGLNPNSLLVEGCLKHHVSGPESKIVPNQRADSLSVIVPVHNGSPDLELSLKALAASRMDKFEIIVVNDHSRENIRNIAEGYGARYLE